MDHLVIVGAGFSKNAGLPLAAGFTRELLNVSGLKKGGPSAILVETMRRFVDDIFGGGNVLAPDEWPSMEDLFTTIDLAANTGHHLGPSYSASSLRTIRRALIVRLIRMLSIAFHAKRKVPDEPFNKTVEFLRRVDTTSVGFLSMNWDSVIEEILVQEQGPHNIDYGCGAIAAEFRKGNVQLRRGRPPTKSASVLKPHGSVNWMYCDACSRLLWFPSASAEQIAARLFRESDAITVETLIGLRPASPKGSAICPGCKSAALGTRFATFSYRKALEFPMHQATWSRAEELLQGAKTWTFFGYSMPAADYQFKHLLKRVHLSKLRKPKITLITKGDASGLADNYRRFFGRNTLPDSNILIGGMDRDALKKFRSLGIVI